MRFLIFLYSLIGSYSDWICKEFKEIWRILSFIRNANRLKYEHAKFDSSGSCDNPTLFYDSKSKFCFRRRLKSEWKVIYIAWIDHCQQITRKKTYSVWNLVGLGLYIYIERERGKEREREEKERERKKKKEWWIVMLLYMHLSISVISTEYTKVIQ